MMRLLLLIAVLGAAVAFGLWRRRTDGRMRSVGPAVPAGGAAAEALAVPPATGGMADSNADPEEGAALSADDVSEPLVVDGAALGPADHTDQPAAHVLATGDLGAPLGERATLVQFSSAFCQPCRATRLVLADVARTVPGVAHVEVDAESHLDLVRRVDVTRTPTVLLLDAKGRIRTRATGAPRSQDVLSALAAIV